MNIIHFLIVVEITQCNLGSIYQIKTTSEIYLESLHFTNRNKITNILDLVQFF